MSTKAQIKTPAKTSASPTAASTAQPPVAVPEREAERPDIATQLEGTARLGHSLGAVSVDRPAPPIIQRQELPEEEDEEKLQMKREPAAIQRQGKSEENEELQTKPANDVQRQGQGEGFQLDVETMNRINRARSGGQPLAEETNKHMSAALGYDFSRVQVHTDAEADKLNQRFQAKAFTTGPDIFFKRGAYAPASSSGQELIAHELTHVVQQSTGKVGAGSSGMPVRPASDALEQEADATARKEASESQTGPLARSYGNRAVQRLLAQGQTEDKKDSEVDALNTPSQTKAFTTGPDIFFNRGAYDSASSGGREIVTVPAGAMSVQRAPGGGGQGQGGEAEEKQEAPPWARHISAPVIPEQRSTALLEELGERNVRVEQAINSIELAVQGGGPYAWFAAYLDKVGDVSYSAMASGNALAVEATNCEGFVQGFYACMKRYYGGDVEMFSKVDSQSRSNVVLRDAPEYRMAGGNILGERGAWFFTRHHWLEVEGCHYDPTTGSMGGSDVGGREVAFAGGFYDSYRRADVHIRYEEDVVHPAGGRWYAYGRWGSLDPERGHKTWQQVAL